MRDNSLCKELSDPQWQLVADLVLKIVESPSKSKTEELRLFKDVLRQMFRNMNVLSIEKICTRFWNKALDILERTDSETLTLLGNVRRGAVAVREKEMSYFSKTIEENRSCFDCYCRGVKRW